MRRNAFADGRSWVYKEIKPRLVCEKYLEEDGSGELRDYKIFCFSGEPRLIQVDHFRRTRHKRNLYTPGWEWLDASIQYPSDESLVQQQPQQLDEMLGLARTLSSGFQHVRVDFYIVNNQIIFGEMTFFPESGFGKFSPAALEAELGGYLELGRFSK